MIFVLKNYILEIWTRVFAPAVALIEMVWPSHARFLVPGINDTWNEYQKLCKGRIVSSVDWKQSKDALHKEYEEFVAQGGVPAANDERCRQYGFSFPHF